MDYSKRLQNATEISRVCVGLDPVPEKYPESVDRSIEGTVTFLHEIIKATAPFAGAYKPNLAFYEAMGTRGLDILLETVGYIRHHAPFALIIGDGKRSDIGSTAEQYAKALFDVYGFDAVTINPYLGWDGIAPFAERTDRGVFLLALTSNPTAEDVQGYGGEEPLYLHIARLASERWNKSGNIGLVVGATKSDKISLVRQAAPDLPFLLPGIGAQGGDLQVVIDQAFGPDHTAGFVNSSRGIIYASSGEDFAEAAALETRNLVMSIQQMMNSSS